MTALTGLSGQFVSVAGRLAASRHGPDEPVVGQVFCRDVTHAQVLGGSGILEEVAGRDIAVEVASNAALGEAFERYGLRDLDKTLTITASAADLAAQGRQHILPSELAPASNPATGMGALLPPPAEDTEIRWLAAADLVTGEETLLPAQYCIYVERPCEDVSCSVCEANGCENAWCVATSNGTAAGPSPVSACLSGLLELIERDAFMLMWYHRLRFPYLRIDPHSLLGQRVSRVFGAPRIDVRFIDLTEVHDVPVVVAVARGRLHGREVHAVGGGSAVDLPTATWKAARELAAIYPLARRNVAAGADAPAPEAITTFIDHLRHYSDPARQHELDFLFEDRSFTTVPVQWPAQPTSPADELRRLSHLLRARRIRTYAVDLTPGGAPRDLFCYKVVSPELIPLDCDHRARHVNKERLLGEPTRRGWRPDRPAIEELNHAPHPFP